MKRLLILFVISILAFSACTEEDEGQEIIGTWDWVRTSGGIGGMIVMQADAGYEMFMIITSKKYSLYRADTLVLQSNYTISKEESITGEMRYTLHINNAIPQSYVLNGDTLTLFEEVYDGFQYDYVRRN